MLQTQDMTLRGVGKAMNRMGELAIMAQDITMSNADRALYAEEFTQLKTMVSDSACMVFNRVEMFSSQSRMVSVDADGGTTEFPAIDLQSDPYAAAVADETSIKTLDSAVATLSSCQGRHEPVVNRSRQGRCGPGQSRGRERAIDGLAYVADLRRQPDH